MIIDSRTPDEWIERLPDDDGPNGEDACPVCGKVRCECPPEQEAVKENAKAVSENLRA